MNISTFLFDFHGVLCKDRFYTRVAERYPRTHEWIDANLFRAKHPILQEWMRGSVSFGDVNRMIAKHAGVDAEELDELFIQGVKEMSMNRTLLEHISALRNTGAKVGLVTDNMDVFTSVFVPHNDLRGHFDVIINSADHGLLKEDNNGQLFDMALTELGESDIKKCLLVDDTKSTIDLFRAKGGHAHQYASISQYLDSYQVLA